MRKRRTVTLKCGTDANIPGVIAHLREQGIPATSRSSVTGFPISASRACADLGTGYRTRGHFIVHLREQDIDLVCLILGNGVEVWRTYAEHREWERTS